MITTHFVVACNGCGFHLGESWTEVVSARRSAKENGHALRRRSPDGQVVDLCPACEEGQENAGDLLPFNPQLGDYHDGL